MSWPDSTDGSLATWIATYIVGAEPTQIGKTDKSTDSMTDVFFQILSPLPLNRQQDARKLFHLWADRGGHFFPNRWGLYEPLRNHFSLSDLDDATRTWKLYYHVKRTVAPRLESTIHMQYGPDRHHATWSIWLKNLKHFEQAELCRLLECAASAFSADLGFVHKITDAEIPKGRANDTVGFLDSARTKKHLYVVTRDLRKFLPDIYWMTVFGRPYVELFSRERLLSCPAYSVKELENGSIGVQLTPKLRDIATEEAAFEKGETGRPRPPQQRRILRSRQGDGPSV